MASPSVLFVLNEIDFVDNLGIASLSAIAKAKGWHTSAARFNTSTIVDIMRAYRPKIICYSVMSPEAESYLRINSFLKSRYNFVSLMGGAHPTFFPEVVKEPGIDYICRGEGELAFADFLDCFEQTTPCNAESIANICSKNSSNPPRNLIEDLDTLPIPDKSIIYDSTDLGASPIKAFMASRGCPFSCSYCFNDSLKEIYRNKGPYLRFHSVERLLTEIETVRSRYTISFIKFEDDVFGVNLPWLEKFSDLYRRNIKTPFNCFQRIDTLTEEKVSLLKEAGCASIMVAIDSANQNIRNEILRRSMRSSNQEIEEKIRMIKRHGLNVMTSTIIGIPSSTYTDEINGLELSIRSRVDYANAPIFFPFSGTRIWHYCREKGWIDPKNEEKYSSLQQRSVLTCFSDREKDTQWNLSVFYPFIVKYPYFKRILVWLAEHTKANKAYAFFNFISKSYLISHYIYPFKSSLSVKLKLLTKAFPLETKRTWNDNQHEV